MIRAVASDLKRVAREVVLGMVVPSGWIPARQRWRVLRVLGFDVAPCSIAPGVFLGGRSVRLGSGVVINRDVLIDGTAPVDIQADVGLAPRVQVITSTHEVGPSTRRLGRRQGAPVVVERGVWLGAGVIVLPGVTVGHGCVVAAGAVVTADCEPDSLYAGVPARRVRSLAPTA